MEWIRIPAPVDPHVDLIEMADLLVRDLPDVEIVEDLAARARYLPQILMGICFRVRLLQ